MLGLVWTSVIVLQLCHNDRHTIAPPHTRLGALPAVPVCGVGADVEPLCIRVVGQSRVRPSTPYTFQVQPSVVTAEQTLQHRPVDRLEVVYGAILPSLWWLAVPSGVDAVGQSGEPYLTPGQSLPPFGITSPHMPSASGLVRQLRVRLKAQDDAESLSSHPHQDQMWLQHLSL